MNDELIDNQNEQNIDSERYSKYKNVFDKHKNEDGYINKEDVHEILNEFGRKTTVENSNELIKSVSKSPDSTNMDFDDFVKLMESDDLEKIINKDEQPKKELTNIQIYLFMLLLLITGSINTIANKFQQNTTSLEIKYKGHQKFITFCMFNGELLCSQSLPNPIQSSHILSLVKKLSLSVDSSFNLANSSSVSIRFLF